MLERWRERDVFHESIRRREGAPPFVFYEGPPTANGRPGSHHVLEPRLQGRVPALQDDARPPRAAQGRLGLPRPARRARDREGARLQVQGGHRALRRGRVQRQVPRVGAALHRRVERADRADRLLDRHRRRLLHARRTTTSSRSGGRSSRSGSRACSTRATRSCPTARAAARRSSSHEVALGYKDVVDPSVYVRFPLLDEPGRLAARLDHDALDARAARGDRRGPGGHLRARPPRGRDADPGRGAGRARAGRGGRDRSSACPARRCSACATSRRSPTSPTTASAGHTVLAGDFVSIEDGTGVVHTGAAFGEDDFRLATDNGLTIHNPVRPDGTFDERAGPFAGHVRARRRPADHRGAARVRPAVPRRRVRARLPALLALRHAAHLLREDELVRAHHGDARTSCWPPTRRSTGTPSTSSTGASATGSRTTWTGRCRASATGARRCRSGAPRRTARSSASARARRSRERGGERPEDVHRPFIDDVVLPCEECGGEMRRVPDLIDVWWDSGCMPFAQWHAPFENEDLFASASRPTTSARRSTRRAAGSTRCWRSRRCCSARRPTETCSASA